MSSGKKVLEQDELLCQAVTKYDGRKIADGKTQASDDRNSLPLPNSTQPIFTSEITKKKLQSIQNLVQKLSELSSSDDRASTTDHIASLCETQNPDHRYVSEILLASGLLLRDLSDGPMGPTPIQLHPSGHPINPDMFFVIEQTKSSWHSRPEIIHEGTTRPKPDLEKLNRKLLFDVVNEILIQKLELTSQGTSNLLLRARKFPRRFPSGQRLLREICTKIEQLQAGSPRSDSMDEDSSLAGEERLPCFCHVCCKIGHEDISCPSHKLPLSALQDCNEDSLRQKIHEAMQPKISDSIKVSNSRVKLAYSSDGTYTDTNISQALHTNMADIGVQSAISQELYTQAEVEGYKIEAV